jgi:hypothetical protein
MKPHGICMSNTVPVYGTALKVVLISIWQLGIAMDFAT